MTPPLGQEFKPHESPQLDDPFPFYARLRREAPVTFAPAFGLYLVSKYQDVLTCLKDPKRFSSSQVLVSPIKFAPEVEKLLTDAGFTQQYPLVGQDPPAHSRTRGFANKAFSPARVTALAPRIQQIAEECIKNLESQAPRADIVATLTYPLPLQVTCEMLGIGKEDWQKVGQWCEAPLFLFHPGNTPEQQMQLAQGVAEYWRYLKALVEERRANPRQDDILTALIEARIDGEKPLDTVEMVNLLATLVFGAQRPTTHLIGSMVLYLLRQPESWKQLVANPALIPQAIEEALRYDAPASSMMRLVTEDVVLSGTTVPKGSRLLLLFAAANRDEEVFKDAERFDITRESANRHLGFGHGTHGCLGVQLARMQVRAAMELLIKRLPNLRLVPNEAPTYMPNILARGPQRLMVEWTPA